MQQEWSLTYPSLCIGGHMDLVSFDSSTLRHENEGNTNGISRGGDGNVSFNTLLFSFYTPPQNSICHKCTKKG